MLNIIYNAKVETAAGESKSHYVIADYF